MANDIDIKIKLDSARAEAQLAAFAAKAENAALSTEKLKKQIEAMSLKNEIAASKLNQLKNSSEQSGFAVDGLTRKLKDFEAIAVAAFIQNKLFQAFNFLSNQISNGIKEFAEYEAAIIRLAKITNLPVESQEKLVQTLQKVSLELGVSRQNLIEYATVAASAGVRGEASLAKVAEVLAKIQLATPVAGEAAAQSILRILNLTNEGAAGIENFGNILAELGDNASITENEILSISEELSRVASIVNLTSTDVQVLATSFGETGASAELARTATLELFSNLQKAIQENNKTLPIFQKLVGASKDELKAMVETNPAEFIVRFTKASNEYKQSGGDLLKLLSSVGIEEKRNIATLGSLISKYDILEKNIGLANKQLETQDKLNNEAAKSSESLNAALARQEGIYALLSQKIGAVFAPIIKTVTDLIVRFVDLLERNSAVATAFQFVLVGLGAALTVFIAKLSLMALGLALGTGAFATLGTVAAAAWAAVTAPITIVVASIASVVFVVAKLTGGWENLINKVRGWVGLAPIVKKENDKQTTSLDEQNKKLKEQADAVNKNSIAKLKAAQESAKNAGTLTQKEIEDQEKRVEAEKKANKDKEEARKKHLEEMKKLQEQIFKDQATIVAINDSIAALREGREAKMLENLLGQNTRYFDSLKLLRMQAEVDEITSEQGKQAKIMEFARLAAEEKFKLVQQTQEVNKQADLIDQQIALTKAENLRSQLDQEILDRENFLSRKEQIEFQSMLSEAKTAEQRAKIIGDIRKRAADNELRIEQVKKQAIIESTASLFGAVAALAQSGGKRNIQIFKAAATAQAIISTYAAINKTLAEPNLPFPTNIIQAAALGIQGFANVRNIQSAGNFESGGIVPGNSFSGDKLTANVNSGEMILNRQQQSSLFNQINSGGMASKEVVVHTTVNVDGETIARAVSKQVANGFQLGEVQ